MSEQDADMQFSATPELAAKIVTALATSADEDEVSGFQFNPLNPLMHREIAPLRPKDPSRVSDGPIETSWTTWRWP